MRNLVRLFAQGTGRAPGLRDAVEQARRAEEEWRLDEALALWAQVRERFPDQAAGHIGHAEVLAKLNRYEEAIADLTVAAERLPRVSGLAVSLARITHDFGKLEDAVRLCRTIVAAFPDDPHGPELLGKSLRSLLQFEEADAVLEGARATFPKHIGLPIEHVASADMRGDYPEGLRRSQALLRDFPKASIAHASVGAALKRLRRYDEADAVLLAAMARFPDNSNLHVNYAWVADDKGDWQEALKRWSAAYERFARDPRIRTGLLESRARADLARIDEATEIGGAAAAAPPPALRGEGDAALAALFTRFEGLGENCEFGFVQRHYGAEPLGLLRWAGIAFDKLLVGLQSSFDGVGGAERTRMVVNPNNQEYVTKDTLYGFDMHTFILRDETNEAATYKKMCRRLEYLKTKLLDDLATAEKVFVFQTAAALSDGELLHLHAAIRGHGPNRLLVVRPAPADRRPGEVIALADGLAAGFIDRVGFQDNHWNISYGCWLELCRGTLALFEPETPRAA